MSLIEEIDYGTPAAKSAKTVRLSIDGTTVEVAEGTSIMRAAMEAGVQVPKLCATDSVKSFGSCRLCLVEIDGRPGTPASCIMVITCSGVKALVHSPAQHPGIQKIQNIFRDRATRLYHWAKNPAIPADNNRAERELRPLVIARKISFGSQSEQGALTRETLMSVLHTLRKRTKDVFGAFKRALDALAQDEKRDPYKLLFDSS